MRLFERAEEMSRNARGGKRGTSWKDKDGDDWSILGGVMGITKEVSQDYVIFLDRTKLTLKLDVKATQRAHSNSPSRPTASQTFYPFRGGSQTIRPELPPTPCYLRSLC